MKNLKMVLTIIVNLLVGVALGTALLCLVFLLPNKPIEDHMPSSAATVQNEGVYPYLSEDFSSTLDNFTDSLMLLSAAYDTDAPVIKRAMAAYRGNIGEENNPAAMLVYHYVGGQGFDREYDYPRYWHGYLVFLRPLLEFLDYNGIRILNGICQALLFILTAWLMIRRKKEFYIIPWAIGYMMLMPLVQARSLQYSTCHYVFMVGSLVLLLMKPEKLKKYGFIVFLNIGIATAYFDLLTYPIVTFGVPMVVYLMLTSDGSVRNGETLKNEIKNGAAFKDLFLNLLKNGICWCIGYGGMWVSKWLLATKILGRDIVADGLSQFTERTSNYSSFYQLKKSWVIAANYKEFFHTPVIYIIAVCLIFLIYMIVKNKASHTVSALYNAIPYFLVALAPVAWYMFATNHSAVHTWFTSKGCVVSVMAMLFGLISLATAQTAAQVAVESVGPEETVGSEETVETADNVGAEEIESITKENTVSAVEGEKV